MSEQTNSAHLIETSAEREVREQREERRRQNKYRKLQVVFNGILTAFTAITGGAVIYQGSVMRDQLNVAKDSATAAREAADIARQTLFETLTQMDRQNAIVRASADAAEASRKDSAAQSKAALDASIEASRREQRAWVGPFETVAQRFPEGSARVFLQEGQRTTIGVTITNFGKTPARKVVNAIGARVLRTGVRLSPSYDVTSPEWSTSVIFPGARFTMHLPVPRTDATPITRTQIAALANGTQIFYLFGEIKYEDVFGDSHHTVFCVYLTPTLDSFKSCPFYNDAN